MNENLNDKKIDMSAMLESAEKLAMELESTGVVDVKHNKAFSELNDTLDTLSNQIKELRKFANK